MAIIRPRLNDYHGLSFTQEEVDFAIPFLDEDIPLSLDPFLLWKSPSLQDNALHTSIVNSFNHIGHLVRKGEENEAISTLIKASECHEVGLGSSKTRRGIRIGTTTAHSIISLFKNVPQIEAGGFTHFEEIQLLVDNISKDRVSDIACNFIKSFLIDYTIDQSEKYGIPIGDVSVKDVYDYRKNRFTDEEKAPLPLNPQNGEPVLLVPKRWLRYIPWLNFDEDRWSWDKYIQRWNLSELDDAERQRTEDSLRYLRLALGEGYLRRADGRGNPMLFWYFTDWSDGARLSMIRFTDALKALEGAPGYKAILNRVKRPKNLDDLLEGKSVIEVAYKFFRAGFSIEFEPRVSVTDHRGVAGPKYPDIKIIDTETGEEIIVEVSRLMPSAHQNLTSHTYHVINHVLVFESMQCDPEALKNILLPYAKILRGIEEDELQGIVEQIRKLVDRVRTSGEFGEVIIPDTIEVGIASYDDHARAREWAASRGMREHDLVEGANILRDEIARAKRKLREKITEQLPDDKPGIVVLTPANENVILFVYEIEWLAAALAEEVGTHPKLLCAIMFHSFDDGKDESWSVSLGSHTYTRLVRSDGAAERSLVIRNPVCKHPLTAETLERVGSAFAAG